MKPKELIEKFNAWLENKRAESEKNRREIRERNIEQCFNIRERGGKLWLVCGDKAIREVNGDETAKQIIKSINDTRKAYSSYNYSDEL